MEMRNEITNQSTINPTIESDENHIIGVDIVNSVVYTNGVSKIISINSTSEPKRSAVKNIKMEEIK